MKFENVKTMGLIAKYKLMKLFSDERGDVNVVAIVVLIGVAVLLAILFKDQIGALLTSLLGTINENAEGVVNDPIGGGAAPE